LRRNFKFSKAIDWFLQNSAAHILSLSPASPQNWNLFELSNYSLKNF
jgi:hypothetical protein